MSPTIEQTSKADLESGRHDPDGLYAEGVKNDSKKPVLLSKESSVLPASDDPFAPREGKTLLWRNVNMVLVRTLCKTNAESGITTSMY